MLTLQFGYLFHPSVQNPCEHLLPFYRVDASQDFEIVGSTQRHRTKAIIDKEGFGSLLTTIILPHLNPI